MKRLIFCLLFISGCSSIDVHPVGHFVNLTENDLAKISKEHYKDSGVDDYIPTENEKNHYYSSLQDNITYRKYLILECVQLMHAEHKLDLKKPVFASFPKWNNVQNWYAVILNFTAPVNKIPADTTMECDLVVNDKKEVSEYQLKKSFIKLTKD
ncbi:MAG: hypothetical protein WC635_05185 [Bacteriovorax sp.]|jgi:hypothetical protein